MLEQDKLDTLGKRLMFLRQSTRTTLLSLQDRTGISRSNLSRYEKDEVKPTSDAIVALCTFYKVSTDWLLLGKSSPEQTVVQNIDPDLKRMIDILKELMESDNPHMRSWAIVQFETAFKEQCVALDEKNPHNGQAV